MAEMINDDTLHANYATCVIVDKPEDDVISSCSDDDGNDSDDMELVEETDAEVTQDGKRKATDDEDKSVKKKKTKFNQVRPMHKLSAVEQSAVFMEAYEYAVKKAKTEMLPIEAPTEENIVVLEDFGKHSDASWSRFVQSVTPGWKRLFKKKNANATKSPIVVILCASALRAVEVRKKNGSFQHPRCEIILATSFC